MRGALSPHRGTRSIRWHHCDSVLSNSHPDSNPIHAEVLIITGSSFRAQGRHRLLQEVPIEQPG